MPFLLFPAPGGGSGLNNFADGPNTSGLEGDVANNLAPGLGSFAKGIGANAINAGETAQAGQFYDQIGDAQIRHLILSAQPVDATPTPLLDGNADQIFVEPFTSYTYRIIVTARGIAGTDDEESMGWKFEGLVYKNTANGVGPAILVPGAKTVIEKSSPGLSWDCNVAIGGGTSELFQIIGTGEAGSTIRFLARVELVAIRDAA